MQSLNHIKTASDVKSFKDFNDDIIYRDFPSTKPRHLYHLSLSSGVGQKVSGKSSGSTRESSLVSFSCWPVPAGLFESPDAAVEIRHDMNRQFDTSLKFRPALSSEWTARVKYHWGTSSKLLGSVLFLRLQLLSEAKGIYFGHSVVVQNLVLKTEPF